MSNLFKILLVLGLVTLCLGNLNLNIKYKSFLNGAGEFDQ